MARQCGGCGAHHPSHGIGPPLVPEQQWFCDVCIQFQPATQAALAKRARDAIEGEDE